MTVRLDPQTVAGLAASLIDIEQLELIADWKDDLCSRIRRALLRFEVVGLDEAEQDQLAAEVEEFKRTCRALCWRLTEAREEKMA